MSEVQEVKQVVDAAVSGSKLDDASHASSADNLSEIPQVSKQSGELRLAWQGTNNSDIARVDSYTTEEKQPNNTSQNSTAAADAGASATVVVTDKEVEDIESTNASSPVNMTESSIISQTKYIPTQMRNETKPSSPSTLGNSTNPGTDQQREQRESQAAALRALNANDDALDSVFNTFERFVCAGDSHMDEPVNTTNVEEKSTANKRTLTEAFTEAMETAESKRKELAEYVESQKLLECSKVTSCTNPSEQQAPAKVPTSPRGVYEKDLLDNVFDEVERLACRGGSEEEVTVNERDAANSIRVNVPEQQVNHYYDEEDEIVAARSDPPALYNENAGSSVHVRKLGKTSTSNVYAHDNSFQLKDIYVPSDAKLNNVTKAKLDKYSKLKHDKYNKSNLNKTRTGVSQNNNNIEQRSVPNQPRGGDVKGTVVESTSAILHPPSKSTEREGPSEEVMKPPMTMTQEVDKYSVNGQRAPVGGARDLPHEDTIPMKKSIGTKGPSAFDPNNTIVIPMDIKKESKEKVPKKDPVAPQKSSIRKVKTSKKVSEAHQSTAEATIEQVASKPSMTEAERKRLVQLILLQNKQRKAKLVSRDADVINYLCDDMEDSALVRPPRLRPSQEATKKSSSSVPSSKEKRIARAVATGYIGFDSTPMFGPIYR